MSTMLPGSDRQNGGAGCQTGWVMEDVAVGRRFVIRDAELTERFSRASGPGGQGVNTTDSRVELSFNIATSPSIPDHLRERLLDRLATRLVDGVITMVAGEHRSQLMNRAAARERLAAMLLEASTPAPRRGAAMRRPSRASRERRLAAKKHRAEVKRGRSGRFDD